MRAVSLLSALTFLLYLLAMIALAGCADNDGANMSERDDDTPYLDDDLDGDDDGDDDDDSDDDDTGDDDGVDDDTDGPNPGVFINKPVDGETLSSLQFDVEADLYNVDDANRVTVLLDGVTITEALTVTTDQVTGNLTAPYGGDFNLRIEAENDAGKGWDEVQFDIDKPWFRVTAPRAGAYLTAKPVVVAATFGNCDEDTVVVKLDSTDVTGQLDVFNGNVSGQLEMIDEGSHVLNFYASRGRDEVSLDVPFVLELDAPHFVMELSADEIETGDYVDVNYRFFDENGQDITDSVTVDLTVDPNNGVAVDDQRIWFYLPGHFTVTASTFYGGTTYIGNALLFVKQAEAWDIEITLSDYDIDAGESVVATAEVTDEQGNPVYVPVYYTVDPPFGATVNGEEITLTRAGTATVRGTVANTGIYDEAVVTVSPGEPVDVKLYCDQPSIAEGGTIHCTGTAVDQYGNNSNHGIYFTVNPGTGVTINGGDLTFAEAGYFVITVHVDGHPSLTAQTIAEVVDVTPLKIVFTNPPRGYYTHTGTVNVTGNIADIDPYTADLTINGEAVYIKPTGADSGSFEYLVTLVNGLNIIEAEVTDGGVTDSASTAVLYGQAEWANNAYISNAMGFRISDLGFDQIATVIDTYLIDLPIEQMIMQMNPVFDESVEVWGVTVASAHAVVTGVESANPTVDFDAMDETVTVTANLTSIKLFFRVSGSVIGIGYTAYGDVTAQNISASANAHLSVQNGAVVSSVDEFAVNIGTLDINIDDFPDELIDLFSDSIASLIEDTAESALQRYIPPLLQEVMAQIPYAFDIPVGDVTFNMGFRPAELTQDSDGATFWMNGRVLTDTINPIVPVFSGSFKTASTRPEFGHYMPGTVQEYGFGVNLGDDIVNQLLYQTFRSGLLTADFEQVFGACDAIIYAVFPPICDTYGNVDLTIKMRPLLPPIMKLGEAKFNDVPAQIQLGDLLMHLYTDDGSTQELVLTLATSATLPTTITADYETNSLSVTFDTPEVVVDTVNNPLALNETLFEALVPPLVELLLPLLSGALQGLQLPSFDGWEMQLEQMMIDGSGNDYIGIYAELLGPS